MKKLIYFAVFFSIIFIQISSFGKYIFEQNLIIANLNIDRSPPEINVVKIENSNIGYEKYASKKHQIKIQVSVEEKDAYIKNFTKENIEIYVGNTILVTNNIEIQQIKNEKSNLIYEITLGKIEGNGKLSVKLKEGIIIDDSGNKSKEKIIDTQIQIDNISPKATFTENKISQGKVEAIVTSNEQLRKIEGWTLTDDKLVMKKEFTSNVIYTFTISDFAQNETEVKVNIQNATYIKLTYASHNSEVGWSYGYNNYDIAGKEAIKQYNLSKTEALAFRVEGNVEADFVQFNSYVHTYWGEGKKATCSNSGIVYSHGYNPSNTTFKTMGSNDLVTLEGKKYIQFGGAGINHINKTDCDGNNPIPLDVCRKYLFGISGIKAKLKDESFYSIIYQIYVTGVGWIEPKADGEEAVYRHDKPMSAIRMTLVPKTEKTSIVTMWRKDVGTNNGIK